MTKKPEIVKEEDLIKRRFGIYYKKNSESPFTGEVQDYYHENGRLRIKKSYKDGKLDGPSKFFF